MGSGARMSLFNDAKFLLEDRSLLEYYHLWYLPETNLYFETQSVFHLTKAEVLEHQRKV
jgi:hypothetical protein